MSVGGAVVQKVAFMLLMLPVETFRIICVTISASGTAGDVTAIAGNDAMVKIVVALSNFKDSIGGLIKSKLQTEYLMKINKP